MMNDPHAHCVRCPPRGRTARLRTAGAGTDMPGKQLLMTFPVTATSHTLADYRARGGYATLAKVLRSDAARGRHEGSHRGGPAGPRRRGVLGRPQVVGRAT